MKKSQKKKTKQSSGQPQKDQKKSGSSWLRRRYRLIQDRNAMVVFHNVLLLLFVLSCDMFENIEPAVHATSWADSFVFCPKHMGNVETLRGGPVAQLSEMQLDQTENEIREWIQRRNTKSNFFVLCMFVSSIERACHRGEQRILQKDYGRLGRAGLGKRGIIFIPVALP